MPFVSRPTAEVYYEVTAGHSDRRITLVNGHTRSLTDFRMLTRKLNEAGYQVLALDNRGAGKTLTDRSFSMADMVEDVTAIWLKLAWQPSSLLGISMGGALSLKIAAQNPDKVERLVLISTSPSQRWLPGVETRWGNTLAEVQTHLMTYVTPAFGERNKFLLKAMANDILRREESGHFAAGAEAQRVALRDYNFADCLAHIQAPTLVIHGEEDRIIPVAAGAFLATEITNAHFLKLPDAGHLLLAEKPETLYREVLAFLALST